MVYKTIAQQVDAPEPATMIFLLGNITTAGPVISDAMPDQEIRLNARTTSERRYLLNTYKLKKVLGNKL